MNWILSTYSSIGTANTFTNLLLGIGVGIIAVRCLHILLESMGEEKKVPWASVKKHIIAIVILVLTSSLLTMVKKYFT